MTEIITSTDRYQIVELLGRGGMGEVHKAFDPQLGRHVALKVMRQASPEVAKRLVTEARSQARVEHPHICKVYAVGELNGQPFIALQYINGETLRELAPSLTREQRIRIMLAVADALHAAHRQGLIHRDVKPANVLVEQTDSGAYHPYVADFGVAREVGAPGATATGEAVGTPLYMAPEQARGQSEQLDRRTDVYGLGATLYELLAGKPPFSGDSTVDVMLQVLHSAPPSLRAIDPSIPADLETVVIKAMEKNPADRYESARAFAEDLQRYLDGDPIRARRSSLLYRLTKRARKQLALVVVSVVALGASLVGGGLALHDRHVAAVEARLAQQFGQETERIAALARNAVLLPLHDLRPEMDEIRTRMTALEARMQSIGPAAAGPGHFALGRAEVTLERWDDAARDLEAAYATGYRSPELAYALGLAHGRLYQKSLAALTRSGDDGFDAVQRDKLARAHREPALRYLKEVGAREGETVKGIDVPEYVEGLIALYEQRYAEALKLARKAAARSPSLFEARTLEGDIRLTAAQGYALKGDYGSALESLELAGEAYRAAAVLARSSPAALAGECWRLIEVVEIEVKRDVSPAPSVRRALAACQSAATARPDDAGLLAAEARAWHRLASYQSWHAADPSDAIAESIKLGEAALRTDSKEGRAYRELSTAYGVLGEQQLYKGGDPRPSLDRSIEYARRALELDPTAFWVYHRFSASYLSKGDDEAARGLDARASYRAAIRYAQEDQRQFPGSIDAWNTLGNSYSDLAIWEMDHGVDPVEDFTQAIVALHKETVGSPTMSAGFDNLCAAYAALATHEIRVGQDPRVELDHALDACKQATELNANDSFAYLDLGETHLDAALWRLANGLDPTPMLALGRLELNRAVTIDQSLDGQLELGRLELISARAAMARGRDAGPAFAAAEATVRAGLKLTDGRNPKLLQELVEIGRWRAQWLAQRHAPVEPIVREALQLAARVQAMNRGLAAAFVSEGALHLIAARLAGRTAERIAAATLGRQALERALAMNGFLARECRPMLDEAARLAPP